MNRCPEIKTTSTLLLDQLSSKITQESIKVLKQLDVKFMMQGLASAARARDYINHLETKVNRESTAIFGQVLEQQLEQVWEIEAKLQNEAWTVTTKMGTIMFKTWLTEASKLQTEMSKTIPYQKKWKA